MKTYIFIQYPYVAGDAALTTDEVTTSNMHRKKKGTHLFSHFSPSLTPGTDASHLLRNSQPFFVFIVIPFLLATYVAGQLAPLGIVSVFGDFGKQSAIVLSRGVHAPSKRLGFRPRESKTQVITLLFQSVLESSKGEKRGSNLFNNTSPF